MIGWKRWALTPVAPFFSTNGAGTFLRIKGDGTADDPKFGLDRGGRVKSSRYRLTPEHGHSYNIDQAAMSDLRLLAIIEAARFCELR
jgi:hypothetical protein